ncbi:ESX secretion system protein EccC [Austwickia sp. TVS 96-490-7B]|uniref:type VII secretion protein EccCa n=1 Tax=Austwickia sp. TVS 96-490-7B TaxID=2830843 RepID=UPI001C55E571|nr:type VII secretion protein EccCa [Austwickia sp. TVS 96-490-7B]MBW3085769.1 ESX secretion system protein EccC [Austwickia sp. TVS 96-490-7B]
MSTRIFARRARLMPPEMPTGEIHVESPPDIPRTAPVNVMTYLMPGAMLLMVVGFIVIGGMNPASLMMGAMMLMMTLGMIGSNRGQNGGKAQLTTDRYDYLAYLDGQRTQVEKAKQAQREALAWSHPHPELLWSYVGTRRMWERRSYDDDALVVRIGVGAQRLAQRLRAPQTGPLEELDPVGSVALRQFVRTHSLVDGLPVSARLRAYPAVGIAGDREQARALARAIVLQLVTFHGPDTLAVAAAVDGSARASWDWLKWLPHNQHDRLTDSLGSLRMVSSSLGEIDHWLSDELASRPRFSRQEEEEPDQRHILIVIDGGHVTLDEGSFVTTGLSGVTLLDLSGALASGVGRRGLNLTIDGDRLSVAGREHAESLGVPDGISLAQAVATARRMAAYRLGDGVVVDGAETTQVSAELVDMLGVGDPALIEPDAAWKPRSSRDLLRVPIGLGPSGEIVELDLKESAQGGMGPHGLVIGATGSGKSELLRTLVLALAISHSPDKLNLILIDFKGGATFAGLQGLPHTAAVITNLADDLAMVDRMYDALSGEMNRRQELLRDAGNFANIRDYERARSKGAPLSPLPSLLVICDEFSEMLTQKPDFAELFVAIGRLGRSLGIHLLLASQRLEENRLRGLDSHLSYRIGLKTFSAAESRTVLGVADAYELPSIPGSGYLKFDTTTMVRFKASYVSGPYTGARERAEARAVLGQLSPMTFVSDVVGTLPQADVVEEAPVVEVDEDSMESVLDTVVGRLAGHGDPAHEVWLPPLDEPPTLDMLLPPLVDDPERGVTPGGWPGAGRLRLPVGVVDLPYEQRRDPYVLDLSGAAGHVAIVGGPRSGKSTALRTLIAGLALTHTPTEVQIYVIDLGGGSLASAVDLPHVGSVAPKADPDRIRRTLAEMSGIIESRERLFHATGVESMADYRARHATGEGDAFGDVFLVIDGWGVFRQEFEELEAKVTQLATQGLAYGLHVILGTGRWADIRPALKDVLGTRLELRLGDPQESEVDRKLAQGVPVSRPGRGVTPYKRHFLFALPRIDSQGDPSSLPMGFSHMARELSGAWRGPQAPAVRMLPNDLPASELQQQVDQSKVAARWIPMGINEEALAPVLLNFDSDPHFLYFADEESGKTNFLRVVASGLMASRSTKEVRLLVVDYRRTMLGHVPPEYLAGYATSADTLRPLVSDLGALLRSRLPGPDVTTDQLRDRSWWSGPEAFILVDDYDLVATMDNPLHPLVELLAQGKDVGLHMVIVRRSGGAGRSLYDPVIQRMRDLGTPGFVGGGSRDEGPLLAAIKPQPGQSNGRGYLVTRRGSGLVQIARDPHTAAPEGTTSSR